MDYDPCYSDLHAGTRYCPDETCGVGTAWELGARPPEVCAKCSGPLSCRTCGECFELDERGLCAECREPRVTRLVAVEGEFGISLRKVSP